MFCRNCGKENADGAKFCIGCGNNLEAVQSVNNVAPVTPTDTQPQVAQSHTVAQTNTQPQPNAPQSPAPKGNKKKMGIIIGIAAAALALIIAIILIFVLGGKDENKNTDTKDDTKIEETTKAKNNKKDKNEGKDKETDPSTQLSSTESTEPVSDTQVNSNSNLTTTKPNNSSAKPDNNTNTNNGGSGNSGNGNNTKPDINDLSGTWVSKTTVDESVAGCEFSIGFELKINDDGSYSMTATSFELNEASFTQAIKNELEGELTEDELQGVLDELGYDTIDEYISDNYSTLADELEDEFLAEFGSGLEGEDFEAENEGDYEFDGKTITMTIDGFDCVFTRK